MAKPFLIFLMMLTLAGCGKNAGQGFPKLAEEFVYTSLAFSPVSAASTGLHRYQGKSLDELMDDVSPATLDRQKRFYQEFRERLRREVKRDALDAQSRADYDIIQDQISLALLDADEIQSYAHNPTVYVELVGNALFNPYVLEYAPKADRARHIVARLRKLPLFLDQARGNLVSAPEIWTRVAMEENEGNINLVDKTLRNGVPPEQRAAYDAAAGPALDALKKFQAFLKTSLSLRSDWNWRLGREKYGKKFRYVLATGADPENTLQQATRDLDSVRARMAKRATQILGRSEMPPLDDDAAVNRVIQEALARASSKHATPATCISDAKRDLEEARRFVQAKNLLTLPPRSNLQVIETPEFMRGIYAVGGFNPAPALEPQLGAFYWITPIPPDWPAERVDSKLREYNFYKLKLLTIHEAVPGHYVQFEYANGVGPQYRRLLRSVFGNGPYIEGWAQYATQVMLDNGFLDNSPELRLTFEKEELRVLANAILDVRLHTLDMTDQEALDLMQKQTFQEAEEATAKLQRAKLSSCQLPTYFVGWRGWNRLRDEHSQSKLADFNNRALQQGAVPLTVLGGLLQQPK